jgi:phosphohistidine phosphatase
MKHLILVRHAQAESAAPGQQDFDRLLTRKGMQEATEMARRLQRASMVPEKIITSEARRAHTTATLFATTLQFDAAHLLIDKRIYSAGQLELLAVLRSAPNCTRLLLVGHNPTISELSGLLSKDNIIGALPTCGVVSLYFDINNWSELDTDSGYDVTVDSPDSHHH